MESNILISPASSVVLIVDCQAGLHPDLVPAANGAPRGVIEAVLGHATAHAVPVISTVCTGDAVAYDLGCHRFEFTNAVRLFPISRAC